MIDSYIFNYKATTSGLRGRKVLRNNNLSNKKKIKGLLSNLCRKKFTSVKGMLVNYNRSFGNKKLYRLLDTKRSFITYYCKILQLEYDPNRNSNIVLVKYQNGSYSYINGTTGMKVGLQIKSDLFLESNEDFFIGNSFLLKNIPLGTMIHNIELFPGKGSQVVRSAGMYAQLLSKDIVNNRVSILLKNGTIINCDGLCRATLGMVSNVNQKLINLGKAGVNRWKGKRSSVRGVAKNPVDHPHGGGNGKTSGGRPSVSRWGKYTKNFKKKSKAGIA